MRAFVVRPFGEKNGVNFDRVEKELIQPALERLRQLGVDVTGGTTVEINRAGNIREDMFRLLVVADLVIADVSIHNANVFYELGIRHALRPFHTFMLRSNVEGHKYPFDLQTDRYLLYDGAQPAGANKQAVEDLAQALRSTIASESASSPVFQLLPKLRPHDRQTLVRVPREFVEDVDRARRDQQRGDLRLYAEEVASLDWDQEGLRLIGEAQFKLRAYNGARETFEKLRRAVPDDKQANWRLGTIYQRLAFAEAPGQRTELLARSDQAIERALAAATAPADRAEVLALRASNVKSRWIDEFRGAPESDRRVTALRSVHFTEMIENYIRAFSADLNAYYPGVNALGLLQAQIALAKALPDDWSQLFDSDAQATAFTASREQLASKIAATLSLALKVDETMRALEDGEPDPWAAGSRADLLLLTVAGRASRVAQAYREALARTDWFSLDAVRRNLAVYKDLGLFEPNVTAALKVVDDAMAALQPPRAAPDRVLLFTGHMVDAPDREKSRMRFPPTGEAESRARALIEQAVKAEMAETAEGGTLVGIAGGACGSDILFHEVCNTLGIETRLFLALPRARFQVASVQRGGPRWVERYEKLCDRIAPRVLQEGDALPNWLVDKPDYDLWQRNNQWMMFNAIATDARRLTLIALFNPTLDADGPGGTAHLITLARRWGFKSVELDARNLLHA
jgi:hypothetical protein